MKLTLVWYGGLNKLIDDLAVQNGYEIIARISPSLNTTLGDIPWDTDVVIDCSTPSVIMENIQFYAAHNLRVVIGTTGWYDHIEEVKKLFASSQWALLWASNFAIGVHIFFAIVEFAAQQINMFPEYDIFGREVHHKMKKDSPSGTTLSVADILLKNIDRKTTLVTDELHRKIEDNELHFTGTRGGFVNFSHEVFFDSADETITVTHSARNRNIYARWALDAAKWLYDKQGYFSMQDWISDMLPISPK